MFIWICPACGKEVPPSETECPHCHGTGKIDEPEPSSPEQTTPQPGSEAPPTTEAAAAPPPASPQGASPAEQQQYVINNKRGLPGWLVALLVAVVIIGIGAAAYYFVLPSNRASSMTAGQQESPFEEVQQAAPIGTGLARHIEVSGFRITEDEGQRPQIQFLVINHSAADIGDLAGTVVLHSTVSDEKITEFEFKTTRLGPYESIEFLTTIRTSLRAYEMPDWQFLRAELEITSPTQQ